MPAQLTNYQCPACTGPLHFSGASGRLECEYCGSVYDVEQIEALYAQKNAAAEQGASQEQAESGGWSVEMDESWGAGDGEMKSYCCPSCGAELICDASTAATSCPYCGNPTIVPGQFTGALRPDYVIPFKLSREDAINALKRHYRGKRLLPSAFTDENHIEQIQGVYVPFWMFDGRAEGRMSFRAERSRTRRQGDYEITETDHFQIGRGGSMDFEKVPVDASSKMPDEHMDSIEPFDYSELKPFSMAYLPGFLADKFDVSAEESSVRANKRCENALAAAMEKTVTGYTSCTCESRDITLRRGKVHYALMPVWLLSTKWNGKSYLFAMNGQTGKLVGDLPVSRGKLAAWFAGIAVPLMALGTALALLLV